MGAFCSYSNSQTSSDNSPDSTDRSADPYRILSGPFNTTVSWRTLKVNYEEQFQLIKWNTMALQYNATKTKQKTSGGWIVNFTRFNINMFNMAQISTSNPDLIHNTY